MILYKTFLIYTLICYSYIHTESCQTPDKVPGTCIKIDDCDVLLKLLHQQHEENSVIEYLRAANCGFIGQQPQVCCPHRITPFIKQQELNKTLQESPLPKQGQCGISSTYRLIDGPIARIDQYPWSVLLEYKTKNGKKGFYCGGSLISDQYVLTAAHCLIPGDGLPENSELFNVRIGDTDLTTLQDCTELWEYKTCANLPQNSPIDKIILHEDYNSQDPARKHDIALIKLANNVEFSDFVSPVCLPTYVGSPGNSRFEVAGWGAYDKNTVNHVKKRGFVAVNATLGCNRDGWNEDQICGVKIEKIKYCYDDMGGALLGLTSKQPDFHVLGILSRGPSTCENDTRVYTNVQNYLKWIVKNVKVKY